MGIGKRDLGRVGVALLAGAALSASAQEESFSDSRFIQPARYPAGSIPDPEAAGGYGTSDNFPASIVGTDRMKRFHAALSATGEGFQVKLINGGQKAVWLDAADGTLQGFLQARDKNGVWQPIQFLWWRSCGNSYHRVQLPSGKQWKYTVAIPKGNMKTAVRFAYQIKQRLVFSNAVETTIPAERFQLASTDRKSTQLKPGRPGTLLAYPVVPPHISPS